MISLRPAGWAAQKLEHGSATFASAVSAANSGRHDDPTRPRLDSWKEIAAYLRRTPKTAQRWHRERDLPVHRLFADSPRSPVYALTEELDAWLGEQGSMENASGPAGQAAVSAGARAETGSPKRLTRWVFLLAGAAGAAIVFYAAVRPEPPVTRVASLLTPRPFTHCVGNEREPAISPGGDRIAYIWGGEPGSGGGDLYVQALAGGEPQRLIETPQIEQSPAWSPGGSRLAFLREEADGHAVVTVSALGGDEEVLTSTHRRIARGLAWTPDGQSIVFPGALDPALSGLTRFSLVTRSASVVTAVPQNPSVEFYSYPVFDPDGSRLVVAHRGAHGRDPIVLDWKPGEIPEILVRHEAGALNRFAWADGGGTQGFGRRAR